MEWMSTRARELFVKLVDDARALHGDALSEADLAALSLMAQHGAIAENAALALQDGEGELVVIEIDKAHGGGTRKRPAWQVYREAAAAYLALAREYGLTLRARATVDISKARPVDDSAETLDDDMGIFDRPAR